jgi:hypothetical protein
MIPARSEILFSRMMEAVCNEMLSACGNLWCIIGKVTYSLPKSSILAALQKALQLMHLKLRRLYSVMFVELISV